MLANSRANMAGGRGSRAPPGARRADENRSKFTCVTAPRWHNQRMKIVGVVFILLGVGTVSTCTIETLWRV